MILPQRIQLKFFFTQDSKIDLHSIIPVFHRWIQTHAVDGLLIDVANYAHVPEGPGVLLVGHEVDYAIDLSEGRVGLLHTRKISRTAGGQTFAEQLQTAIESALQARDVLAQEASLDVTFVPDEIELRIVDRLVAVNSAETFATLQADITTAFTNTIGNVQLAYVPRDRRRPLTIHVKLNRREREERRENKRDSIISTFWP